MPLILVFIDGLDGAGAGRFKSSEACALVVTLPFDIVCADVEVSEVLPSCEYVDVDDTDALEGGAIAREFSGLEGIGLGADMSFATDERYCCGRRFKGGLCRDVEPRNWGKGPPEAY